MEMSQRQRLRRTGARQEPVGSAVSAVCADVEFSLVFDLIGRPCGARCQVRRCGWEQRIPSPDLARWLLGEVQLHASTHQTGPSIA